MKQKGKKMTKLCHALKGIVLTIIGYWFINGLQQELDTEMRIKGGRKEALTQPTVK